MVGSSLRYEKQMPEADIGRAAALAAEAFDETASFAYIFLGPKEERISFLEWLFERNFYMLSWQQEENNDGLMSMRCAYNEETNELVSFFVLFDSSAPRPGLWALLRAGLLGGFFKYSVGTMQRMVATKDWFDARYKEVIGDRRMLLLERMTVLPKWQGQGIGSKALGNALNDADEAMLPCVLATQSPRNVTFYKRLGFEVVDESHVPEELGGTKTGS